MAFTIAPMLPGSARRSKPSPPSSATTRRRPRCCAAPLRASRTQLASVEASALAEIASSAELQAGPAARVVALHAPGRAELLRLGEAGGAYTQCWPPHTALTSPASSANPGADEKSAQNAMALLASTSARSPEQTQILQVRARALLKAAVQQGEILGGVVLTKRDDTGGGSDEVLVLSVHHPDSPHGACFDPEFAGADWHVNRFAAVHPPLSAWEASRAGERGDEDVATEHRTVDVSARSDAGAKEGGVKIEDPFLSRLEEASAQAAPGTGELAKESDFAPKARLVVGAGALDGIAIKMRDVSRLPGDEVLRVFTVCGWNEARIQPLTIECEALYEAGHLTMVVGANVHAANLTLDVARGAVERLRDTHPHVVVGFGGGAALDGAKAVAALAGQSDEEVAAALARVQEAAARGEREATVRLPRAPLPAVLVPGIVGSGAELSERVLLTARVPSTWTAGESTRRHSVFVTFDYPAAVARSSEERLCVVDPRVFSPRRLNGRDAAQGALMVVATALDALLCARAAPQARALAEDALQHASDHVLAALREPGHSDGPARDALARASAAAALARDACDLGVATLLAAAVVDSLRDGAQDGEFRQIFVRIAAGVVREAACVPALEGTLVRAARICTGDMFATPHTLAEWVVMRAEDVGVPQMRALGVRMVRVERSLEQLVREGCLRNVPHPEFERIETLRRIVHDAMENQMFEL